LEFIPIEAASIPSSIKQLLAKYIRIQLLAQYIRGTFIKK